MGVFTLKRLHKFSAKIIEVLTLEIQAPVQLSIAMGISREDQATTKYDVLEFLTDT